GKSCSTAKVGQRYSVIPCIPCGACAACREGKTNCCENVSLYGIHNDAAGYIDEEKYDVAACVGATWIAGGVAGTIDLLAKSLKP
ncbi:alcohol dehydrogenase catalytic domain-containing protein, partial [Salmonella enterica subsp. enterica serovar Kentucky]|nr:alcohol dehydrogenase catalytic domain-containing protein [Salmonella enterica subsp. enterica serovar Kentucky]